MSSKRLGAIGIHGLEIGYPATGNDAGFLRSKISFSALQGELIALIGPNGIGKSTLLRTMAGFLKQRQGDINYQGRSLRGYKPHELARLISFVSTDQMSISNMRVSELVAYGRFPYTGWLGRLTRDDLDKVREAIGDVGLTRHTNRMVSQLSDGERQRALIARAITQDTPFILLDEPTAFLDVENKYEIFHLLHRLAREQQKTIVLSTHDLNIALREMDKVWMMLENDSLEGAPEDAVLQGWLDRLFPKGNIAFDAATGAYYVKKVHAGTASVQGDGPAYYWTIRALERRGYYFTTQSGADLHILLKTNENGILVWQVDHNGNAFEVASVYDLFNAI